MESEGGSGQAASLEMLNGTTGRHATWPKSVVRLTEDYSCRTALLDDLHELSAFLSQQIQEVNSGEHRSQRLLGFVSRHVNSLCMLQVSVGNILLL